MTVCPHCHKQNDLNNRYCGYCGTILITNDLVVDGKKNKSQLRFLNELFESVALNIIYILVCMALLGIAIGFSVYFLREFNNMLFGFGYHINQILVKFSYILEGMSFSYISSSVIYILDVISFFILGTALILDIPVIIFYIVFGCYIFCYRRKNSMYIKKPVALIRLKMMITKYSLIFNIIITCLLIAILLVKLGGI